MLDGDNRIQAFIQRTSICRRFSSFRIRLPHRSNHLPPLCLITDVPPAVLPLAISLHRVCPKKAIQLKTALSHPSQISLKPCSATNVPNQSPLPLILHPSPSAATTAVPSSLGHRTQISCPSTFKISIGIAVPVTPKNWLSAAVR